MSEGISASAPGNIFFFGEHSVVYERPAIVAAIDMRTYSKIIRRADDKVIVRSGNYGIIDDKIGDIIKMKFDGPGDYKNVMDPARDLIGVFADKTGKLDNGFEIDISSDIPRNSGGMSSSTAVLCSILSAMNSLYGHDLEKELYFDWLYPLQVKIHGGKASGSEITSSSMGGYNMVRIDKSGEKVKLERKNLGEKEFHIVIGNTGVEAKTAETVPYVMSGWNGHKESYEVVFDRIAEIVKTGEKAILGGETDVVGELMNENHELLARDLGVSHPLLNKLVDSARKAGAYGAKLSAGGKGGIMIALTDEDNKTAISDAIKTAGGIPYITTVGVEGIRIENI
jgi:mevalonate kinase